MKIRNVRVMITCYAVATIAACNSAQVARAPLQSEGRNALSAVAAQLATAQVWQVLVSQQSIDELPSSFELNPRRTEFIKRQLRAGIPIVSKEPWIMINEALLADGSRQRIAISPNHTGNEVSIVIEVAPNASTTVRTYETVRSVGGSADIIILNKDGSRMSSIDAGWAIIIALKGNDGIILWNRPSDREVVFPGRTGFRRFQIDLHVHGDGWQVFEPIFVGN